jgi:hypothetical protein
MVPGIRASSVMTRWNGVQSMRCPPAAGGNSTGVACADTLEGGPAAAAMSPLRWLHDGSSRATFQGVTCVAGPW